MRTNSVVLLSLSLLSLLLPPSLPLQFAVESVVDCKAKCDHHSDWSEYEKCLKRCSKYFDHNSLPPVLTNTNKSYPLPPTEVRLDLNVIVRKNLKYLQAKVHWKAKYDKLRAGFYLSFIAKDAECEKKFPGFYTPSIPSTSRSFDIPLQTPDLTSLTLSHQCTYKVELHSVPYPYGDPKYATLIYFTIPTCVNGFCSCSSEPSVPPPLGLEVRSERNEAKAEISWEYAFPRNHSHQDIKEFHLQLGDLFRTADKAPFVRLFKWRPLDIRVPADIRRTHYSLILPSIQFTKEYKVQVFAVDRHICRSEIVEKEFKVDAPIQPNTGENETREATINPPSSPSASTPNNNPTTTLTHNTHTPPPPHYPHVEIEIPSMVPEESGEGELDDYREYFVVFLPIVTVLFLFIIGCFIYKFYASKKKKALENKKYLERLKLVPWTTVMSASMTERSFETNVLYTEQEISDAQAQGRVDKYEIAHDRLRFGRVIGKGAFGCLVYMGTADAISGISGATTVALKQLNVNADEEEKREFLEEIEVLKKVGHHPNIVNMYGCSTLSLPYCMVMEYVPYGDLQQYLRNLRKEFERVVESVRVSLERDYVMSLSTHSNAKFLSSTPIDPMQASVHSNFSSPDNSMHDSSSAEYLNSAI